MIVISAYPCKDINYISILYTNHMLLNIRRYCCIPQVYIKKHKMSTYYR